MTLQTERLRTMDQLRAFVEGSEPVDYRPEDRAAAYGFVRRTLARFDYRRLGRADKGVVRACIGKVCGFSPAQITRLIRQQAETGAVEDRRGRNSGRSFGTVYTPADVRLLAEVDGAYEGMSGLATCEVLRRQFEVHGDPRFERLARLSRSHLYNLRASRAYRTRRTTWGKTRPSPVAVAVRKAPEPNGRPGFLRVDTVHSGDRDGRKGLHVVNVVDEVTQYEHLGAVPRISERFMVPQLEALLLLFPFDVLGFHADNGSEYVNRVVAKLLNKLRVGEFTKSRPRRSNDNALVEGKNARVVRRHLGHEHIPIRFADDVERFLRERLSPFLNFHRPCLFAAERADAKGKVRRTYRREDVKTPLEKLKSLPDAASFLREGVTFDDLDRAAAAQSDLQAAKALKRARDELFRKIHGIVPAAA